jgi:hypothetical protein
MPQESRMERLRSGLSAMERSKLVLDSYRFNTREDPLIRGMMPSRQGPAFNEAIHRMNAANMYIAHTVNLLEADLELLWSRWLVLHYVTEWRFNLVEIEEALREGSREKAPRAARGAQRAAQAPTSVPLTNLHTLLDLTPGQRRDEGRRLLSEAPARVLLHRLVSGFGRILPCMRAVEIVPEEFAATFGGIDPLKPAHRKRLTAVRERLDELAEALELFDLEVERRSRMRNCWPRCEGPCR